MGPRRSSAAATPARWARSRPWRSSRSAARATPTTSSAAALLLFSVLMCALVHVATGSAYFRRAKQILRETSDARRQLMIKRVSFAGAVVAAVIQLIFLGAGIFLILVDKPPALFLRFISQ